MWTTSRPKNVSTEETPLAAGVLCYLHLWATLVKRVKVEHADIMRDIGLWSDDMGGYFAAYTPGNRRMLQIGQSYVCGIGEQGPVVGQLDKIPPCTPIVLSADAKMLLDALAQSGTSDAEKGWAQIAMIAAMIEKNLPAPKKMQAH